MGKKQKIRSGAGDVVVLPGPLDKQIEKTKMAKMKTKINKQINNLDEDEKEEELNDALENAKISKMARQLKEHAENEDRAEFGIREKHRPASEKISLRKPVQEESDSEPEENDDEEEMLRKNIEIDQELLQIKPEDEEAVKKFLKTGEEKGNAVTLYDLLQKTINEKKVSFKETFGGDDVQVHDLNPEVVALYEEVGKVMSSYRCGKIPKAFKIIPSMVNWEQILELTKPENWSAAAMLHATRLFAAGMSSSMCQRFYNLVLLPRIRDDIDEYKKLNFHLYECLFKAIYKPAAFFKGFLIPLCESGTCTLREAMIIGSVLRKNSIPMLHAAAAMLKISEMEYCGSSSLILRILIEKHYTLPFRAIDGLVFNFLRMKSFQDELPVLWHQCLLSFVQLYKSDISTEQREALLELLKVHSHYQITPEIRRQLQFAKSRNEESEANVPEYARDEMEF